ncbi:Asp-tRNA(Asn)/Glu-tRNA(Gln) amidotransferase subunit GatA [Methanobrevibacter sp. OttesenSCG-928-K11]|nr:Asp-tRNA(Asn)/Glu-tRNA(Gln) amidotransferase subunit GatA [Methanobrevibacter sp. OttesenSCG-928-K11]MDL2271157.1 Asp-tRNA(Asn)/Glu-tRNA(Gln) amidotransferase subunit GatA [Methanobrevibacter sp. OttesenSCG-928-I08]
MNIFEKSQAIKNQELKAKDNLDNFIKIIDDNNESINAFLEINKEAATLKAEEIDKKIQNGEKTGSLAGLVFGIKANISVEDFIISGASKTLDNYQGSFNATIVDKIIEEDGIILGMTNLDEFAAGNSTESSFYGPTNNPAAPGRIPGGSSGGGAAAIAAEMCDISICSDTGGSVRNPASHCGVIGFKPTYGAISRQGLLDLSMSLDQIGPMANDSTGIAMALDTIVAHDATECTSIDWTNKPNFTKAALEVKEMENPFEGVTIAVCDEFKNVTDDKINEIVDKKIDQLSSLGANVINLSFNHIDLCLPTFYLINYVEFFSATRKYDGRKYGHKVEDVCGDEVLRRIELGSYISQKEFSGKYYKKALQARSLIKNEINSLFKDADLVMGPTVPKLPHKIGDKLETMEIYAYDTLTVIANLAGIPAGSIKAGEVDGIPVGLQIQAKAFEDEKIIKAFSAIEEL